MLKVPLYNLSGEKQTAIELDDKVFHQPLAKEIKSAEAVLQIMLANQKRSFGFTKTRGEVKASKKKPWRQKGTGRARAGTVASPIWRGGGVVFGPRAIAKRRRKINKKVIKKTLATVVSDLASQNKIMAITSFSLEKIKTKQVVELLNKLPPKEGTFLVVLDKREANFELSAANLPYLEVKLLVGLNALDMLRYSYVIFAKKALKDLEASLC